MRTPPNTRNARALMACLAMEPQRVFAREELIERFWPEIDPQRGRANLATALWAVRFALQPDAGAVVRATRNTVALAGDVSIDVFAFERGARSGDAPQRTAALRAYRGDFLPEHTDPWSAAQRERLAMIYEAALQEGAREARDPDLAWKALERDPFAEDAYAVLVDHALALRNRSAARGLLTRWEAALRELGSAPDAAFRERVYAADALADAVDASPLPAMLSSFIGRLAESARVEDALAEARLVTLTGSGGAGKTRLAVHVARSRGDAFPGGLSFVDLASVRADGVAEALAAGLGCDPRDGEPIRATARMLSGAGAPRLALIDNCEGVIEHVAAAIEQLLAATEQIRFLVTSREPLRLSGEHVVALPPLPMADAMDLFFARAREAGASIGDDPVTRAAVTAICARLDGLPLALELAAARAAVAPLAEYELWLSERFDLLHGTRRGGRAAHRTLRALYDDGFARLDEDERLVFRRMACVAAPWSADALVAVCADGERNRSTTLAALWRLADKSFVVGEADGDRARYRLLESSRAYALERLNEAGDGDLALRRHLAFYVAAAEHAERIFDGAGEPAWEAPARALAADHAHLADALRFAIADTTHLDAALALIAGARRVWLRFGPHAEAARLIRAALDVLPSDVAALRAGALWAALADIEITRGAYRAGADAATRAVDLLSGDDGIIRARSYVQLVNALQNLDDPRAADVMPLAIASARASSDDALVWYVLVNDALERIDGAGDDDLDAADAALSEAVERADRVGRPLLVAATSAYAARLAGRRGAFAEGLAATYAAIRAYRELRAEPYLADALVQAAWFARASGEPRSALTTAAEAFEIATRLDHVVLRLMALDEFGAACSVLGDDDVAAWVRGYRDRHGLRARGPRIPLHHVARHAALGASLRSRRPAAYAAGERANFDEIVALLAARSGV